jgi:hypothetical protein
MSTRRIATRHTRLSGSEEVNADSRLVAASGGDVEHAARIEAVLADLRANSKAPRSADVICLPSRRPYDREREPELELPPRSFLDAPVSLVVWAGVGLLIWVVLAALAFGLYSLLEFL